MRTLTKPYAGAPPDTSMLTHEQAIAFKGITERFIQGEKFTLLQGFAGVGKTFMVGKLIHWYLAANRTAHVCMTAPTNKAVKVLHDKADFTHTNLKSSTVHSLLALKEQISNDGVQTFARDKYSSPQVDQYNLIIVDECSMIGDDLFHMLYEELMQCGAIILFVGDPAQIPPINTDSCIPLDPAMQAKYGIGVFTLNKIVRQAEGNPIIAASMRIREDLDSGMIDLGGDNLVGDTGVIELSMSSEDDKLTVADMLRNEFMSDAYKGDPDYFKVIAYTNKTVDYVNGMVRGFLYGEDRKMLEPGERLVANKPIMREKVIQFFTSEEFQVVSTTVKEDHVQGEWRIKYYETLVSHEEKDGKTTSVIWVVHEDSEEEYLNIIQSLADRAKKLPRGSALAGKAWREFFEFQRRYAEVKYAYAITGHKAQGSTYANAMVMVYDIATCRKVRERNRILYTACTRPSHKLIAVGW